MSRNTITVLIYHRQKLLDLINKEVAEFNKVQQKPYKNLVMLSAQELHTLLHLQNLCL
jgi:hypothetical protein